MENERPTAQQPALTYDKDVIAARNSLTAGYNNFLQKSFIAVGVVGGAVMLSNLPIVSALRSEDIRPFLDANNLTDTVRYFSNHVRNGGQAIVYTQVANMALGQIMKERAEDKGFKENGYRESAPLIDRSALLGTACFVGNMLYEGVFGAMNGQQGVFDTHDVLWVGLGAAALTLWNKTSEMVARHKFPEAKTEHTTKPLASVAPAPAAAPSPEL